MSKYYEAEQGGYGTCGVCGKVLEAKHRHAYHPELGGWCVCSEVCVGAVEVLGIVGKFTLGSAEPIQHEVQGEVVRVGEMAEAEQIQRTSYPITGRELELVILTLQTAPDSYLWRELV